MQPFSAAGARTEDIQIEVRLLAHHHTVLKLTPDRHMKMKHRVIFMNFFGSQEFSEDSQSLCRCRRSMMTYNALMNEFYDVFIITSELWNSVRPALRSPPNLKISLIGCPSGVNFGTV